ncbi:MAG: asparaginase [Corynebacterium sp.]|nr:asparaginase [Corynebacterium sp.]
MTRIALLATGGTIACAQDELGALVPRISGHGLVAGLNIPDVEFEIVEVTALDSSAMNLRDIQDLCEQIQKVEADPSIDGILITHGTDSMEETAMALDLLDFHTPIAITGAQRPFDDPNPDGPENLRTAIKAIQDGFQGVKIIFGGRALAARGAYKRDTEALDAFESLALPRPNPVPLSAIAALGRQEVEILTSGSSTLLIDACRQGPTNAIVVAGKGSGNVSPEFADGMVAAVESGLPVVLVTRVPEGPVAAVYGGDGGGATLARKGVMFSNLRAPQARIALAVALAAKIDPKELL